MNHSKRVFLALLAATLVTGCAGKTSMLRKQSEAQRNLGEAYLSQGNFTAALKELLEAERLYSNDYLLHDDLGKAYTAKKRYESALIHFKRAIELQPDYAPAKNNLGSVYLMMNRWDDAIKALSDVSDNILYATPQYPLYNLGWAYYNKKMYTEAISYYTRALDIQENFVLPMRGIGLCHLAEGRLADATLWFEKGMKAAPDFQQLQYDLAGAYLRSGAYDKAQAALQLTISIDAKTPLAQKAERDLKALSM